MRDPLTWRDWPAVAALVLIICAAGMVALWTVSLLLMVVFG